MINYVTEKLADHKSAQCRVRRYDNGDICLQSYNTDVIYAVYKTGFLYCTGTYSTTTRKHISWFLREYFPNVSCQAMRDTCHNKQKVNVRTGPEPEVTPLTTIERELMDSSYYGTRLDPGDFI